MTRTYAFVDEWDVRAPIEAVFDALSDPERYPLWWKPVYLAARLRDENVVEPLFKGRLPYRLRVTLRLAGRRRPAVPPGADAHPWSALPLEPQLGYQAGNGRAGAVRAASRRPPVLGPTQKARAVVVPPCPGGGPGPDR
jgi:hypothetical protein